MSSGRRAITWVSALARLALSGAGPRGVHRRGLGVSGNIDVTVQLQAVAIFASEPPQAIGDILRIAGDRQGVTGSEHELGAIVRDVAKILDGIRIDQYRGHAGVLLKFNITHHNSS